MGKLTVPPELALKFFAVFSRFEYALKVIPRFRRPGDGEAKADWLAFAAEVAPHFVPNKDPATSAAFTSLADANLRYFAVVDGEAKWRAFPVPEGISDAEKAIRLIRQVRNNLFHGGKYAPDPDSNPDRERRWVESSLAILGKLLTLSNEVQAVYDN